MLEEIRVPKLGEGIQSTQVTAIFVEPGQQVTKEQALVEVESDKASLEIPAPCDGIVKEIKIQIGDDLQTGHVILYLETEEQKEQEKESSALHAQAQHIPKQYEASPKKAEEEALPAPKQESPPKDSYTAEAQGKLPVAAAPSVRRLARELGVEIEHVPPSGPMQRISEDDVKAHVKRLMRQKQEAPAQAAYAVSSLPDLSSFGPLRREKMSALRWRIAQKMSIAWHSIPHVTQCDEADTTALEMFRKKYNKKIQAKEHRLSLTTVLLKILALALRKFPQFNAVLDMQSREILYREYVHLGIAVDTKDGLIVPVLRDLDRKDLTQIALELSELIAKAKERSLAPEELQASCMTFSNLGALGTSYFTPIINWPEAAVLGVGRSKHQAVFQEAMFQARLITPLSLSYDHRLIDGADAARFLRWIIEGIEYPLTLFTIKAGQGLQCG